MANNSKPGQGKSNADRGRTAGGMVEKEDVEVDEDSDEDARTAGAESEDEDEGVEKSSSGGRTGSTSRPGDREGLNARGGRNRP